MKTRTATKNYFLWRMGFMEQHFIEAMSLPVYENIRDYILKKLRA